MASFQQFGNDLYTGARSVPFVGKRRIWFIIAAALMLTAVLVPVIRGGGNFGAGFNFGIDFRGGSQFIVNDIKHGGSTIEIQSMATKAVHEVAPSVTVETATLGTDAVRVQTDQLSSTVSTRVTASLASTYGVKTSDVSATFIGASWGADVTRNALIGLLVFVLLSALVMAVYFRTWKMSAAAMVALLHDVVITVGVYAATGFEITPAAMIGFLTILGFSLYDTVVVFDKIRESQTTWSPDASRTFGETVNLSINQTLVRSINTGVVAALPVAAILFIGAFILGADTLKDISLALLTGTIIGTYSTPFVASPLYCWLRQREERVKKGDQRILASRAKALQASAA